MLIKPGGKWDLYPQSGLHPAFQKGIRRLYLLPIRLSMAAIHEHAELSQVSSLESGNRSPIALPSYDQVRTEVQRLSHDPDLVAHRSGAPALPRVRQSPYQCWPLQHRKWLPSCVPKPTRYMPIAWTCRSIFRLPSIETI